MGKSWKCGNGQRGGGILIQETGGHVLRSLQGKGSVYEGVCDEARKITNGFGKMEATGNLGKTCLSGTANGLGRSKTGGRWQGNRR